MCKKFKLLNIKFDNNFSQVSAYFSKKKFSYRYLNVLAQSNVQLTTKWWTKWQNKCKSPSNGSYTKSAV